MKVVFLQLTAGLFALGLAGITACQSSGAGGGSGCGAPPKPGLDCARGQHSEGGACVANSRKQKNTGKSKQAKAQAE